MVLAKSDGAMLPSLISSVPTAFCLSSLEPTDSAANFSWVMELSCMSSGPIPPSIMLSPRMLFFATSRLTLPAASVISMVLLPFTMGSLVMDKFAASHKLIHCVPS